MAGEHPAGLLRPQAERSSYHYKGKRHPQAVLSKRIKEIGETRVRYGYRRIHVLLRCEGWQVNAKRVWRLIRGAGVERVTWRDYEEGLDEQIAALWDAVQSGRYRALPSRWVYIPKSNGKLRPLGIAALEDKIVQHAVTTVLNAVYEADFLGFSYGFREGRS